MTVSLCLNPNTGVILSLLHWSPQQAGHMANIHRWGLCLGGWRPFSVGLGSLEKQVVPENSCWMQQEWSFHTCALNSPSPQSNQHTEYSSGLQQCAKEAQEYSDLSQYAFLFIHMSSVTCLKFVLQMRSWSQFHMNVPEYS